jgi:hypothetical protein
VSGRVDNRRGPAYRACGPRAGGSGAGGCGGDRRGRGRETRTAAQCGAVVTRGAAKDPWLTFTSGHPGQPRPAHTGVSQGLPNSAHKGARRSISSRSQALSNATAQCHSAMPCSWARGALRGGNLGLPWAAGFDGHATIGPAVSWACDRANRRDARATADLVPRATHIASATQGGAVPIGYGSARALSHPNARGAARRAARGPPGPRAARPAARPPCRRASSRPPARRQAPGHAGHPGAAAGHAGHPRPPPGSPADLAACTPPHHVTSSAGRRRARGGAGGRTCWGRGWCR